MNKDQRTVVVTGASGGIGRACALRLDALGWRVFATVRDERTAADLRRHATGRLTAVILDVTLEESVSTAADEVEKLLCGGGLSALVNNAGTAVFGPLEHTSVEELRNILEVNLIGLHSVTRAFTGLLRKDQGRIVNLGSVSGVCAFPLLGAYSASKFALEALTDVQRVELAPAGIKVSLIEAGRIATPIWRKAAALHDSRSVEVDQQYLPALQRMRRAMDSTAGLPADHVADVVVRALESRRPKTRYLVGADAWKGVLMSWLPDRWRDRLLTPRLKVSD